MVVDFQHHFTPRELFGEDLGDRRILTYDAAGTPSYMSHRLLYDLDAHIEMMDICGIDAAVLTSLSGMVADLERSKYINDKLKEAERKYPGRFIGVAHVHPMGGPEAMQELARCATDFGFPGVVICSEFDGLFLDAPELEPFWTEVCKRGLFVSVQPPLKLNFPEQFTVFDTARSVGCEFSLIMATIRLINSGVFDRHPQLTIHMAHLAGGIASMLGRIRSFQDKEYWGTQGNPRHGMLPKREFGHYLSERMVFDTAGFGGEIGALQTALVELPARRIVFATDYPQDTRSHTKAKKFVEQIKALGNDGARILVGNAGLLLKQRPSSHAVVG
jgi:predicted TIM-barrel fold metal-dependent hydrolase